MGRNSSKGIGKLSLVPTIKSEEVCLLDKYGYLSESVLRTMGQDDARKLLKELRFEEVDGPAETLIYGSDYPPSTFIELVLRANFPASDTRYHPTLDEMRDFLECEMTPNQSVASAYDIVASPFHLKLFHKYMPLCRKYFLFMMEMSDKGDNKMDAVSDTRSRTLRLVKMDIIE